MSSLLEMVFRALPLAAAWNAARGGQPYKSPPIWRLAQHVKFVESLSSHDLLQAPPDIKNYKWALEQPDGASRRPKLKLWGFDARNSATSAKDFTCLVDAVDTREYMRMKVFEKVDWGYVPKGGGPSDFTNAVEVVFEGNRLKLPLDDDNRLLTFCTKNAYTSGGLDKLWPLELRYDASFLHVFVFDLLRDKHGAAVVVTTLQESPDTDDDDIDDLVKTCRKLNEIGERVRTAGVMDKRTSESVLFDDDLWETRPSDDAPYGVVPSEVVVEAHVARIAVICSMGLSLWDEDAAAGRATGEASVFPHLMVASTAKVEKVRGAVHLVRPTRMQMLDHEMSDTNEDAEARSQQKSMMTVMHEMMEAPNMGSLCVADSNADAMVIEDEVGGPVIAWANLFNYYLPDPNSAFENQSVHVVRRGMPPRRASGLVERDCADIKTLPPFYNKKNQSLITKFARQGAFDNLHIAPRMNVDLNITSITPANQLSPLPVDHSDVRRLKMKKIIMAPFCVHDCFHLHVRWTDHDAGSQVGIRGWGPKLSYQHPGAPMVPYNQDVYFFVPTASSVIYLAEAFEVPENEWQVICHHGAFYAMTVSYKVELAQDEIFVRASDGFHGPDETQLPVGTAPSPVDIGKHYRLDWALFYWRLRYRAEESGGEIVAKERFRFINGWRAAADL